MSRHLRSVGSVRPGSVGAGGSRRRCSINPPVGDSTPVTPNDAGQSRSPDTRDPRTRVDQSGRLANPSGFGIHLDVTGQQYQTKFRRICVWDGGTAVSCSPRSRSPRRAPLANWCNPHNGLRERLPGKRRCLRLPGRCGRRSEHVDESLPGRAQGAGQGDRLVRALGANPAAPRPPVITMLAVSACALSGVVFVTADSVRGVIVGERIGFGWGATQLTNGTLAPLRHRESTSQSIRSARGMPQHVQLLDPSAPASAPHPRASPGSACPADDRTARNPADPP